MKILDQLLRWSKWYALRNLNFSSVPSTSGIYQFRWAINGELQLIRRVNGDDGSGLLYVGTAANLRGRIKLFWRGIVNETIKHTAAHTYFYYGYKKKFKPDQLEVRWTEVPKESDRAEAEENLIGDYIEKCLDRPPLNILTHWY